MLSENKLERVVEYWKEVLGGNLSNTIRYIENHLIDIQFIKVNEDYYILYNILTENKEEGIYVGKIPNENKKYLLYMINCLIHYKLFILIFMMDFIILQVTLWAFWN